MITSILIMFATLFIGSAVAPSYIIAEDWKAVIKACIVILISTIIIRIIIYIIIVILAEMNTNPISPISVVLLILIITIIIGFCINIIALKFASNHVDGFEIKGMWTYIILALLISIFQPKQNNN